MYTSTNVPIEIAYKAITLLINNSDDKDMPKISRPGRLRPGWWCESLTRSKSKVAKFRRDKDYKGEHRAEYRKLRNTQLANIHTSGQISCVERIF